jgi:hypothetical protein
MPLIAGRQQHTMGLDATHVAGLEVTQYHHAPLLHGREGDVFDQAADDGAGLRLTHINLLHVQAAGVGRGKLWAVSSVGGDREVHRKQSSCNVGS